MSILKKFNEVGQEISSEDLLINENNFQLYIDQYGVDRAAGYKDAFADIVKQITALLITNDQDGEWSVSDQVAGRRIEKLHNKNVVTLEKMNIKLSDTKLNL